MKLFTKILGIERSIIRIAIIAISQGRIQSNRVAVHNTTVSGSCGNRNILDLGGRDVVVDSIIVGAVQIQRTRINIEVNDIAGTGNRSVSSTNQLFGEISFTGSRVFPLEGDIVVTRVGCGCCVRIGCSQRIAISVSGCIGRIRDVGTGVVGVRDAYTCQHIIAIHTGIAFIGDKGCRNMKRSAVVGLVCDRKQNRSVLDTITTFIHLEVDVHGILANTTQQTLIQINNADRSRTITSRAGTAASYHFSRNDNDVAAQQGSALPSSIAGTTGLAITRFCASTSCNAGNGMQFGNTAVQTTATAAGCFGNSTVANSITATAPSAVTSFGCTRNLIGFQVGTALANANRRAELGRLTTVVIATHIAAASATASNAKYRGNGRTVITIAGKQAIGITNAGCYGSCTTAATASSVAIRMGRCTVTIGVHDDSTDPAIATAVVTANAFSGMRCMSTTRAVTTRASAASNEIQRCSLFDVCGDLGFATRATGGTAISITLIAAARTVQNDFIRCIKRSCPAGVRVIGVIGTKRHISRTDILLVDIEVNLFVGLVIRLRIIAVIGHSITPEPLPDFLRVVVIRIQTNTVFQVRSEFLAGSAQSTTGIKRDAQVFHGLSVRIDCGCSAIGVRNCDLHVHVAHVRHIHINGDRIATIHGRTRSLTRIAVRELIDYTITRQNVPQAVRGFNSQFRVTVHCETVVEGAPNLEIIIGVNADVIIQIQFSTGIGGGTVTTVIVVEVIPLRLSAGLALKQRVIITTDVFQNRLTLEIEVGVTKVHRVSGALDMQSGHDNPLGIRIVYISIGIFGMNIVDGDIRIQISAASNLTERRTSVFSFKLIDQLAKVRIFRDIVPGLNDVCKILVVLSGQTNTVFVVVCITIDVDRIDNRGVLARIAGQIILVTPVDNRSQQTIPGFCQYTGRERNLSRVFSGVIIRNQRINTVIRATRTVPVINGSLIGLFRPVVLTETAGTVILIVMLLHHQCLTIKRSRLNGRCIDNQFAITGRIVPGIVVVTIRGSRRFCLGALCIEAIACHQTEVVVVPYELGGIQVQGYGGVLLCALLIGKSGRTPETTGYPATIMHLIFEAFFDGIHGFRIQCIPDNLASIDRIQRICAAERRRCGEVNPGVGIRRSGILDLIAVSAIADTLPVIGFEHQIGGILGHDANIRRLRHIHRALFNTNDALCILQDNIFVDSGIGLSINHIIGSELNTVASISQHGQLYIDRGMRNCSVTVFASVEYRHTDDTSYSSILSGERGAGLANLNPVANRSTGRFVNHTVIPSGLISTDGLIVDKTRASQHLAGSAFPVLIVLNRSCFDVEQFQRNCFAVIPEMRRNTGDDRAVLSHFVAVAVIDPRTHDGACACIDTRQVRDQILVYVVDNAGEIITRLQEIMVILVPDMNSVPFMVLAIVEQLGIAQLAVNTGNTGCAHQAGTGIELEHVDNAAGAVGAQVPAVGIASAVFATSASGVLEQSTITRDFDIKVFGVPVTGEVFDRLPRAEAKSFQVEVFHQFIAVIQRIPEAAAILQGGQNLLGVGAVDAVNEMGCLLIVLIGGTNFTLLALGDPHQSVHTQTHFFSRGSVPRSSIGTNNRQVTDLVHNEVTGTSQIEVVCALPSIYNRLIELAEASIRKIRGTTIIIDPDVIKGNLAITMGQCGRNSLPNRELVRPVCRCTVFDIRIDKCIFIGITAVVLDMQAAAAIDGCLAVRAMRTARRHDCGRNSQRIDNPSEIFFIIGSVVSAADQRVGIVFAHQSVHIPVAAGNFPAVYAVVAGSGIVGIDVVFVIDVVGVTTATTMGIEPSTGISVHGIMADTKAVAITDVVFQRVIRLTRQIRLRVVASAPIHRIDTIGTFCVFEVLLRINVEIVAGNGIERNMRHTIFCIAIVGCICHILLDCKRKCSAILLNRIAEQNLDSIFIGGATSRSRDTYSSSLIRIALYIAVVIAEVNGFSVPVTVNFQLVAIG